MYLTSFKSKGSDSDTDMYIRHLKYQYLKPGFRYKITDSRKFKLAILYIIKKFVCNVGILDL